MVRTSETSVLARVVYQVRDRQTEDAFGVCIIAEVSINILVGQQAHSAAHYASAVGFAVVILQNKKET